MSIPLNALIIEDSHDDALLVVRELRRAGYDVTDEIVETAQALHAALDSRTWDIVLSDYSLPHFNGVEALNLVRARDPDLPFILFSGTISEDLASAILQSGAQDFIIKGNWARLIPAVERELREAEDRRKRRRAEESLRESEERYRLLAENATDVIWTMDMNHRFTYFSPSVTRLTGFSVKEALGRSLKKTLTPASYEEAMRAFSEETALESSGGADSARTQRLEFEQQRKDGSTVMVEVTTTYLRDPEGHPVGILGVTRDITERRSLEEKFLQAQKLESVGRLAGGVAHDFNNLLTVILGYSDMILGGLPEEHPLRPRMEEIKSAGERAAALTNQLLAFSRKQVAEPEVLYLNEVVRGMTKMLQRMIGEDIGLVTDLDPALERVKIDPVQIEQVIMNLAVNARDAMPAGGRLTIATRNTEIGAAETIPPTGPPPGRYVTLTFADTGCGMTPEVKARLFEPFFTTKERGRGTGLGLATVYGIVQQSGGGIRVESEPGKGAAFTITLPRVEEALVQPRPVSRPKDIATGKETVLVVEDDEVIRNLVREVLEGSGYTVLVAYRGAEALKLAGEREGPIHLLITDVVMPGISGPEVAGHLARYRPEMKVLYISGYTDDKIGRQGLLESGAGFLQKPFRIDALTCKVREVLDT